MSTEQEKIIEEFLSHPATKEMLSMFNKFGIESGEKLYLSIAEWFMAKRRTELTELQEEGEKLKKNTPDHADSAQLDLTYERDKFYDKGVADTLALVSKLLSG